MRKQYAFNAEEVDKALGHLVDKVKGLGYMLDDDEVSERRVQQEITNIFLELSNAHSLIVSGVKFLAIKLEILEWEEDNPTPLRLRRLNEKAGR